MATKLKWTWNVFPFTARTHPALTWDYLPKQLEEICLTAIYISSLHELCLTRALKPGASEPDTANQGCWCVPDLLRTWQCERKIFKRQSSTPWTHVGALTASPFKRSVPALSPRRRGPLHSLFAFSRIFAMIYWHLSTQVLHHVTSLFLWLLPMF